MNKENCVLLRGKVAFEPEVKELPTGHMLGKIRIDCKSSRGRLFIDIDVWRDDLIEVVRKLSKGQEVEVIGELRSNVWTTKAGEKRSKHVVVPEQLRGIDNQEGGAE